MAADQPVITPDVAHEGVTWSGGVLDDADAEDATFVDCAFTGLTVAGGRWERSAWRSCELAGVRFAGCGSPGPAGSTSASRMRPVGIGAARRAPAQGAVQRWGAGRRQPARGDARGRHVRGLPAAEVDLGGARLTGWRSWLPDRTPRPHQATLARVDLRRPSDVARGLDRSAARSEVGQVLDLAPRWLCSWGSTYAPVETPFPCPPGRSERGLPRRPAVHRSGPRSRRGHPCGAV